MANENMEINMAAIWYLNIFFLLCWTTNIFASETKLITNR